MLTANNKHAEFFLLAKVMHKAFQQKPRRATNAEGCKRYLNKQTTKLQNLRRGCRWNIPGVHKGSSGFHGGGGGPQNSRCAQTIVLAQENLIWSPHTHINVRRLLHEKFSQNKASTVFSAHARWDRKCKVNGMGGIGGLTGRGSRNSRPQGRWRKACRPCW